MSIADRIVSTEWGLPIRPGWLIKVDRPKATTFVFISHVQMPDGSEWIECMDPAKGGAARSFSLDRIREVHRPDPPRAD